MLEWLWPRRTVTDSEDISVFYTGYVLTEISLKAFLVTFFPAVL